MRPRGGVLVLSNDAIVIRQDLLDNEAGRNERGETLGQDADAKLEVFTSCAHLSRIRRPPCTKNAEEPSFDAASHRALRAARNAREPGMTPLQVQSYRPKGG